MQFVVERLELALGPIQLVSDGAAVRALDFSDHEQRLHRLLDRQYRACSLVPATAPTRFAAALDAYFHGAFAALDEIPVRTAGTAFQEEVWAALRHVRAPSTTTYGQLAAILGRPGASRAVGLANGANPVAIIVPCHRVVGADRSLTGYGGGLERKAWLLAHERAGRLL